MKNYILMILTITLLIGCAARSQYESDSLGMLREAEDLYAKGKYQKAALKLEDIILTNPGSTFSIDAQMLLAKSYFYDDEYLSAITEFRRLVSTYSRNEYSEEAQYMIAECYFALSPRAELDQSYTKQALSLYEDFIENNPSSDFIEDAKTGKLKCRNKLARKEYLSAELYYKMEDWQSVILYGELVIADYSDTDVLPDLYFIMAKTYENLEEFDKARTIYTSFLSDYPDHEKYEEVEKSFNELVENPAKH